MENSSRDKKHDWLDTIDWKQTVEDYNRLNKLNMEKQLNITLEEAKNIWPDLRDKTLGLNFVEAHIKELILKTWSENELEGNKGYTWEDSFDTKGYAITKDGTISTVVYTGPSFDLGKGCFKTKEQAESALAFAQLSHIVAKMNGVLNDNLKQFVVARGCETDKQLYVKDLWDEQHKFLFGFHPLTFVTKQLAELSLSTNRQLWEKYWMI